MGSAGAENTSQASAEETLKTNEPPQEQTEESGQLLRIMAVRSHWPLNFM